VNLPPDAAQTTHLWHLAHAMNVCESVGIWGGPAKIPEPRYTDLCYAGGLLEASVPMPVAMPRSMREEDAMIKKVSDGYKVVSEKTGKNLGGPYKTKKEAEKRLRQVEYFKHSK